MGLFCIFVSITNIYTLYIVEHKCLPHSTVWVYLVFFWLWFGAIVWGLIGCCMCLLLVGVVGGAAAGGDYR